MTCVSVESKGPAEYPVRVVSKAINQLGYSRVVLRTDGENAITALAEAVRRDRGTKGFETIVKRAPKKSSQTMGSVERANQEVA